MNDILNKTAVLVLNRNWQVINIRTLADVFCRVPVLHSCEVAS
jgi:hypothetical protein